MNRNNSLVVLGGISGIVGTACCLAAIAISMSPVLTYAVAMTWPVLSIVFLFALNRYIALEKESVSNQLAFIFACLGFTLVATMMSVQLAVNIGLDDAISNATGTQQDLLKTVKHSLRWVDLGIDVAWDIFIGVALLFLAVVLSGHSRFGLWWGLPSGLLGGGLIILNVATFPWPPDTRGLFDLGPVIGLFIIILSGRLLLLGRQLQPTSTAFTDHRE